MNKNLDNIDKKTNVLHLISSLEVGGAEKLLVEFLKASKKNLIENNISYCVVVINDVYDEQLKIELESTGYPVTFLNKKEKNKNPIYLFKLLNIVSSKNIQVIHTHDYGSKMWSVLCKILKPSLKLVHTLHTINIIDNLSKLKLFIHKHFIDYSIGVSNSIEKECKIHGILKSGTIYNGIDTEKFINLPRENSVADTAAKIVNIARITHKVKGQDVLIQAVKVCKDKGLNIKCGFVGGSYKYDAESQPYLNSLVNELNLENDVEFMGNQTDIHEILKQSDIFVLPSRYEGLGLVILEAMASGIPVIASNTDGPAELINNGYNGILFESENYNELADKIQELACNIDKRKFLSENALDFVKKFDIKEMIKNYSNLYDSLLQGDKI